MYLTSISPVFEFLAEPTSKIIYAINPITAEIPI